jgi:hypothetical protein
MKHNGMTVKIVGSKGWPDRIFVTEEGKILFCEFKAVWGHISAMQEYVADKLHARGIEVYIITGFKQFKETYNAV